MNAPLHFEEEREDAECAVEFQNLPTDVILSICYFCDVPTLVNLSRTCKRLHSIVNEKTVWFNCSKTVNVTNQVSKEVKNRSFYILPYKERCRISFNWNTGRYRKRVLLKQNIKYMPWIHLDCGILWLSQGSQILALQRKYNRINKVPILTLNSSGDDICCFVVKNGEVICGKSDGSLFAWNAETGSILYKKENIHSLDVNDIDCNVDSIIVTGSMDQFIKLWSSNNGELKLIESVFVHDRVLTVAMNPCAKNVLCYGTSGRNSSNYPLSLYDMERCEVLSFKGDQHKYGAGILDALWEDPFTLISCGYDCCVRIWDTRTAQCMMSWADPIPAALYSLASDHSYTLLCGTALHGRVQMWDKRYPEHQQMYFTQRTGSSPVYSLAFDPTLLFVALDQSLNILDFSGFGKKSLDYRSVLQ